MTSVCASSTIAAVALSYQKTDSFLRTTKTPFLSGKKLRVRKYTAPVTGRLTPVCVAADPDRPLWFPGSTPPRLLHGSTAASPETLVLIL
ncbi:hypothetical protein SLEP1_g25578 [Rubroshorea leprosula]|uniref:Uncharacterized protein n=1 Tax=Rubroshorea leprosula TaxID=152421 RepID=A0AAV5JV31_9ROSI|nr:hypothetical protein SLEP1_g25578 [Rubroshorea leprosula]